MKKTVFCREPKQAHQALTAVLWPLIKSHLLCGGGALVVSVRPETRKEWQSRKFHWLIGKISDWIGGDLADKEDAKRILISAFKMDTRTDPALAEEWEKFGELRMGRGLRGEVVLLGTQSRDFSIKLAGAFCVWLEAFCAEYGIVLPAWREDEP